MPYLKTYAELGKFLEEHPDEQWTIRLKRPDFRTELTDEYWELKKQYNQYVKACQTLTALIELCEDEPLVTSDLHVGMDAAMLVQKLAMLYREYNRVLDNVGDLLNSAVNERDDTPTSEEAAKEYMFMVLPSTLAMQLQIKLRQMPSFMPGCYLELAEGNSSETKLYQLKEGTEVGLFRTFTKETLDKAKDILNRYEHLIECAELYLTTIVAQELIK